MTTTPDGSSTASRAGPDAEGPGWLSGRPSMDRPDADAVWVRTVVGWHVAFWLLVSISLLAVAFGRATTSEKLVGVAALLALSLAYRLIGMDDTRARRPRWASTYLTVLVVVVATLASLPLDLLFILFIAYPQVWFFSDRRRHGVAWTIALTLVTTLALLQRFGWSTDVLRDVGPSMGVSLLFSLLLGLWIAGVIDQSQERADLIAELERTRSALAQAHHAAGVVAERERMAQEIHDTLAQGFTSIVALSQVGRVELDRDLQEAGRRLEVIEATARENLAEARALVAAFAPAGLDSGPLTHALRRLTERFTAETGLPVSLELPQDAADLPRESEVVLLRAAQEALANVRRHAGAGSVLLRLALDPQPGAGASVEVVDDGRGFDPTSSAGFGLSGMRNRVEVAGGSLELDSAPGRGTRVRVSVPVGGRR